MLANCKIRVSTRLYLTLLLAAATLGVPAFAADFAGRYSLGVYSRRETFVNETAGTTNNDTSVVTARALASLSNISAKKFEGVIDIRDKHDLYGHLDQENLRLTQENQPGVWQLALRTNPANTFRLTGGRFPIADAGVLRNDGILAAMSISQSLSLSAFIGLGAARSEPPTILLRASKSQGGLVSTFQKRTQGSYAFTANSLVLGPSPIFTTLEKTLYLFHQSIYAPRTTFRLFSLAYLSLKPKTILQSGTLRASLRPFDATEVTMGLMHYDLSEFADHQDLRNHLPASAYREASVDFKQVITDTFGLKLLTRFGQRASDKLTRNEAAIGPMFGPHVNQHLSFYTLVGVRQNFQTTDTFVRAGLSIFHRIWSLALTESVISERDKTTNTTLHPLISQIDAGVLVAQKVFVNAGIEYAKDETVSLSSGLITIGYRFGKRPLTPLRTEAPAAEDQ